jgi:hypothetical protein
MADFAVVGGDGRLAADDTAGSGFHHDAIPHVFAGSSELAAGEVEGGAQRQPN